jgi:hypothetical protein
MTRVRLRSRRSVPPGHRSAALRTLLIAAGAAGAAALTATYPEVGLPLNVGAGVLGTLYAVTRDSQQPVVKSGEAHHHTPEENQAN